MKTIVIKWRQQLSHSMKTTVMEWLQLLLNEDNCYWMKTTVISLNEEDFYGNEDNCNGMKTNAVNLCTKSALPLGFRRCHIFDIVWQCQTWHLCNKSIRYYLWVDNAKHANNANNAFRQCQIFTQWHLCKSDNAIYADNANRAKNAISYISLDDCRFGIVWAHN